MTGLPTLPALVEGAVHHTRHRPDRREFTHGAHLWLVDLDAGLTLPAWARPFISLRPEDHLAGESTWAGLRDNVIRVVEREGIDADAVHRVVLLANARVLGHVFDPMSMFWLLDAEGDEVATIVEVHNTYGERHAYVLPGQATPRKHILDKEFYVSPFNDVSGSYGVRHRLTPERLDILVRLEHDGEPTLTATVTGTCAPATSRHVARALLRNPVMPHKVSTLIRFHGIRMWLGRMPVQPRPSHSARSVQ